MTADGPFAAMDQVEQVHGQSLGRVVSRSHVLEGHDQSLVLGSPVDGVLRDQLQYRVDGIVRDRGQGSGQHLVCFPVLTQLGGDRPLVHDHSGRQRHVEVLPCLLAGDELLEVLVRAD